MVKGEQARLRELRQLALLDTPPEERFDRIARLAIQFFGVEAALVTLVDEDRQWFKSRQGIALTQTCRTESFCAHAIQEEGIFEIEDASQDSRFKDFVLVKAHRGIRFYAGVPMTTTNGFKVGQVLRDLAACAEDEINRSHSKHCSRQC